jgi:hypothetical protein
MNRPEFSFIQSHGIAHKSAEGHHKQTGHCGAAAQHPTSSTASAAFISSDISVSRDSAKCSGMSRAVDRVRAQSSSSEVAIGAERAESEFISCIRFPFSNFQTADRYVRRVNRPFRGGQSPRPRHCAGRSVTAFYPNAQRPVSTRRGQRRSEKAQRSRQTGDTHVRWW